MCGRAYGPRFLFTWPNARISVMGGEQAASVLATVHRDADKWTPEEAEAFRAPIRQTYEDEGTPSQDRQSVVSGKSVSVRVELGRRRIIIKNKHTSIGRTCESYDNKWSRTK